MGQLTLVTAVILGGWCLLFWYTFGSLFAPGPSEFVPDPNEADPLEAHRWLRAGAVLAPRRFPTAGEALRFVDQLYALGAVAVRIVWLLDASHAEGLLVTLPRGPEAVRRRLFAVAAREAEGEGVPPDEDRGQPYVKLLWND